MFQAVIAKMVAKHGLIPLILFIGDIAVKVTKSKKDDKIWNDIKMFIKKL